MASSHPVITSHFHSANSASWLSTSFLLTQTSFQPLVGGLSDAIGRKIPYLILAAVFSLGTLWCAVAGSMLQFILARAVCGLGAGGMMTLGSIIMSDVVPIEIRPRYQSLLNVTFGVGSMMGAGLGGLMADCLGWRWEFGVQVPVLIICVGVSGLVIPGDLGLYGKQKVTIQQALREFDFWGAATLAGSVTGLVLGVGLGGNVLPWSHPVVVGSLMFSAVVFPVFLWVERWVRNPIMPLHLVFKAPHMNLMVSSHISALLAAAILGHRVRPPPGNLLRGPGPLRNDSRILDHLVPPDEVAAHHRRNARHSRTVLLVQHGKGLADMGLHALSRAGVGRPRFPVPGKLHGCARRVRAARASCRDQHPDAVEKHRQHYRSRLLIACRAKLAVVSPPGIRQRTGKGGCDQQSQKVGRGYQGLGGDIPGSSRTELRRRPASNFSMLLRSGRCEPVFSCTSQTGKIGEQEVKTTPKDVVIADNTGQLGRNYQTSNEMSSSQSYHCQAQRGYHKKTKETKTPFPFAPGSS
ncbi:Putative efflux permease [Podospora comata]|uniref:Efflux permease n=1 Tax=Podospora comata TaxID=48703 RepID=A0ABY6RZW1_PODCO|nr:Putative efflux permease [Podospora comata]